MNPFDLLKNAGQLKEQAKKIQDEMQNMVPAAVKWLL